MAIANEPLVLDLIEWVGETPRPYSEVISAWRTSCPRLTVWEDAVDLGFLARQGQAVAVTKAGRAFLADRRPHQRPNQPAA